MRAAIRTATNNAYTESPGISTPVSLYLADAQSQTTATGQNRSAMNAFQHGLSGNRMILQDHELEAYRRLSSALHHDYAPATETERQFVQKIIDCHTRLNRIVAIENNILNIGVHQNTNPESGNDPATEAMIAQARAWTLQASSFDKLGRYEARISRQLVQYTKELDRIQALRRQAAPNKPHTPKIISFRQTPEVVTVGRKPAPSTDPRPGIPTEEQPQRKAA